MSIQFGRLLFELAQLCGAVDHSGYPSAVTATTLADTRELPAYDDDHFIGRRLYVYEGSGIGQERVITDSVGSTTVLTVATWEDTPVVDASRYCILKPGWRVDDLRTSFRQALRERRAYHMRPLVDEETVFVDSQYDYEIPPGFAAISRLVAEDGVSDGYYNTVIPNDVWEITRDATRKIRFFEEALWHWESFIDAGRHLQITGQKYEDEPDSDSDSIEIPVGNIMTLAAYYALSMARTRDPNGNQGYGATANIYYQRFLEGRGDDEVLVDPNSRMVY
jgi:hypothetical protein